MYKDNWLAYILTPEGRIVFPQPTGTASGKTLAAYYYEYQMKDHLGNVRVTFTDKDKNGVPEVQSENHYYPFGMPIAALSYTNNATTLNTIDYKNEFFYNGKEAEDDFGLGWLDYGWRQFDPIICRWWSVDPLSEKYRRWSPYNYCVDNPLRFIDPDGMTIVVTVQETDQERKPELETKYKQTVSDAFKGKVSADIDKNGKVSFSKIGKLDKLEKNAFKELDRIAKDEKVSVSLTLIDSDSQGAGTIDVGSFDKGAIDLDDIAAYGNNEDEMTSKGKLVHETVEQYEKTKIENQTGNKISSVNAFGKPTTEYTDCHKTACESENRTSNFQRGVYFGTGYMDGRSYNWKDRKDPNTNQIIGSPTYKDVGPYLP